MHFNTEVYETILKIMIYVNYSTLKLLFFFLNLYKNINWGGVDRFVYSIMCFGPSNLLTLENFVAFKSQHIDSRVYLPTRDGGNCIYFFFPLQIFEMRTVRVVSFVA